MSVVTRTHPALRIIGARTLTTAVQRPPPPPELQRWMSEITARRTSNDEHLHFETIRRLQSTLPTRLPNSSGYLGLPTATETGPLPKGYHLAFFNPQSLLTELGEDGSSTELNAPSPYLRRMWAGGSFRWSAKPKDALRIGANTNQLNSVVSADYKSGMIFVNQQRELYQMDQGRGDSVGVEPQVREIRTHVFRKEVSGNEAIKAKSKAKEQVSTSPSIPPTHTFTYTPTPPLLFRFSALTYNAHRIHYDRDWCRSVENHPDLVVHGPMTAMLLIELAEKVAMDMRLELRSFEYRATSPMYVDKEIQMDATLLADGQVELMARQEGRVGMRAVATLEKEGGFLHA